MRKEAGNGVMYGIDPGPINQSIVYFDGEVCRAMNCTLADEYHPIFWPHVPVACEWIESYGMAVGASVFRTVHAIGWLNAKAPAMRLIPRRDIKLHLCGSMRAKDANIRQALIDRFGHPGTKKKPGLIYGIKSHYWAALAVAVTAMDLERTPNEWTWNGTSEAH